MDNAAVGVALGDGDQVAMGVEQGDLSRRDGIKREGCRIDSSTLGNRPGLVFVDHDPGKVRDRIQGGTQIGGKRVARQGRGIDRTLRQ